MAGPTPAQIEHYLRMFELLDEEEWCIGENLGWTVVRPHGGAFGVDEVIRRLGGDPATVTTYRPADVRWEDDLVYLEQRGDAVMILEYSGNTSEVDALLRLSQGATVHGVLWGINNYNRLFYAVDGVIVTDLDTLRPEHTEGTDPLALDDHLGALRELHDYSRPQDGRGADWDWPTAMATLASLTDLSLDADWFLRPQSGVIVDPRKV
jgi:hypothetical protein